MHHHIYKNAGTTFDWILHRNFAGGVLHIEGDRSGARLSPEKVVTTARPFSNHQAITSHACPLPAVEKMWARCHVTFIRDPLRRIYSMYRFDHHRMDDTLASRVARERNFDGYCEWWLEKPDSVLSNWQTRCCTPQSFRSDTNRVQ